MKSILHGLGSLVFPHNCILCQSNISELPFAQHGAQFSAPQIDGDDRIEGRIEKFPNKVSAPYLCRRCELKVKFNTPPFCLQCSRHLEKYTSQGLCRSCQKVRAHYDFSWAVTEYNDAMRRLIHLFKYRHKTLLRKTFGFLMHQFITSYQINLTEIDCLIPLPLHSSRQRERGFNQAELLAELLAPRLNVPVVRNNLKRTVPTQNQARLGLKERFTNIHDAFTITRPQELSDRNILLVDDLLTTGATASEAAKAIKNAGAARVGIFTLAIAN